MVPTFTGLVAGVGDGDGLRGAGLADLGREENNAGLLINGGGGSGESSLLRAAGIAIPYDEIATPQSRSRGNKTDGDDAVRSGA